MSDATIEAGQAATVLPDEPDFSKMTKLPFVKGDRLKVMRLTLPSGKSLPEHKAPGEITVHCLLGHIEFSVAGTPHSIRAGQLLYLPPAVMHSVLAIENSVVLLSIAMPG